jgi:putative transposase
MADQSCACASLAFDLGEQDFARRADYIHFNPVKHGLVSRMRDSYSSFYRMVWLGAYPLDWGGNTDEAIGWGEG